MFGLYVLALAALVLVVEGLAVASVAVLLIGFTAIVVLDPIAARKGEAPLFFARLRPTQIPIAVAGLAALLVDLIVR